MPLMFAWILHRLAKLVARLPWGAANALARHWGWVLAHVVRLRRAHVLAALARGFPEKTPAECRAIYAAVCRQQALNAMELLRYVGGRQAELQAHLDVCGMENVKTGLARGNGVLVLIAHFGNYALLALQVPRLFGYPLSVIAKPLRNRTLNEIWWELQRQAGVNGIPATSDYADARQAEIIAVAQDVLGRRVPCLYGGSVNPENCAELIGCPSIDGLFIGRSAWQVEGYLDILARCAKVI